ncbi:small integral membrane protein 12 isoform B [Alligator mississippiensis]|uniref:Small integral membrane protein 12 isoform B n=1 Tax=Alligator mississippiensis TaxID=8496 RepID=A0A151PGG9_ALLMI|nr:small integral membrane protein 12 isoform B [Alligator mississippiensis]
MWPLLWATLRTYAPYVTFPVALVVGAVGYHVEQLVRGPPPPPAADDECSIAERREERALREMPGHDPTRVRSLKDRLEARRRSRLRRCPDGPSRIEPPSRIEALSLLPVIPRLPVCRNAAASGEGVGKVLRPASPTQIKGLQSQAPSQQKGLGLGAQHAAAGTWGQVSACRGLGSERPAQARPIVCISTGLTCTIRLLS